MPRRVSQTWEGLCNGCSSRKSKNIEMGYTMSKDFKAFQKKMEARKFAIENSWRGAEPTPESTVSTDQIDGWFVSEVFPWEQLNENLEEADACKYFDGYLPITSHRKILGRGIVFCKRAVRKLLKIFLGWYIFPQYQRLSHFHGKMVNAVSLERDILTGVVRQNQNIAAKIDAQETDIFQRLDLLRQDTEHLCSRLDAQLRQQLLEQEHTLKSYLLEQSEQFKDAVQQLQSQLDGQERIFEHRLSEQAQHFEERVKQLECQLSDVARENVALRDRLFQLENLPTTDDNFYHAFEEEFRGTQAVIKDRLQVYVPILKRYLPDWSQGMFIDVGSGRGEWLDILRENGAKNYIGVDLNERQIALCTDRGHPTVQRDCIEYLSSLPENSVALVTGFQIIEHLCMSDLMSLLRECYRVLKPGGVVLLETQNPKNLVVGADTFYIDPSHKRPLDPGMMSFLVRWCGYQDVQCIDANSHENSQALELPDPEKQPREYRLIKEFNDVKWLLFGPQDYAILGVKRELP